MAEIEIRTLHDPEGAHPFLPDYWLAWANGMQGDGTTEDEAIASAKARLTIADRHRNAPCDCTPDERLACKVCGVGGVIDQARTAVAARHAITEAQKLDGK